MESKPKLYYFDSYGRAEPIRMAYYYAKEDFEDIRLSGEKFQELKVANFFPFGQVPVFESEGKKRAQSMSILRYHCQKWGFYPNDPELIYAAEALVDYVRDTVVPLVRIIFGSESEEEKKEKYKNYYENVLPDKLEMLERFYEEYSGDGEYMVGKVMSIADFIWLDFYWNVFLAKERKEYVGSVLEKRLKLKKYWESRTEKDWKEYLAKRPESTSCGF